MLEINTLSKIMTHVPLAWCAELLAAKRVPGAALHLCKVARSCAHGRRSASKAIRSPLPLITYPRYSLVYGCVEGKGLVTSSRERVREGVCVCERGRVEEAEREKE